jgi:pyruvate/2-oxoglutarate dehydrogenase complex dihydrolipoamide dehydrogenase (E3) component
MEKVTYDIIIIGAGSGGLNVAGFFSQLKLKVLLIDKADEHIGGDCLNTGCIPSKALIHVANQVNETRNASRFLSTENHIEVDIKKVTEYILSKQNHIRKSENPEYLENKGIDYMSGEAKFVDTNTITINGSLYTAKNLILATGSRARKLSIENDKSLPLYTNENIFSIDFLPKKFVFIGGGPINCELGQAFSRFGSHVTILNSGKRILEKELEEVSGILQKTFSGENITVTNNTSIVKIADKKVWYTVVGSEEIVCVEADAVFVGIGRELNIDNLDLEKGGIHLHESGTRLLVDEYLRTTNQHVYVVGDVAGNYQFTHAAEMHAKVVIKNMLSPFKVKFDAKNIAWVTYTSPQVATFGISKKDTEDSSCLILQKEFGHDDRAIVDETTSGKLLLYIDKNNCIQGGTMISENAGEIAQELILAMSSKIKLSSLFNKVYPYPTASRINKQISGDYMRSKLTTNVIRLLRLLYKIV